MNTIHHAGGLKPLSSRNLIRNGGAAVVESGKLTDWEDFSEGAEAWRRVPAPDFNAAGLPRSAHAIELVTDNGQNTSLRQVIKINAGSMRRFAFRLAACSQLHNPVFEIVIRAGLPDGAALRIITRFRVQPSPDWKRYRFVFDLTEIDLDNSIHIEIRTNNDHSFSRALITDLCLVALYDDAARFSVRFETRGSFMLPSSRLRAFMIEDYLNLLGWRASINKGTDYDLLVSQKVRRWVPLINAWLHKRSIIYDLDDNDPVRYPYFALSIRSFAHSVDGITAGGEFLYAMMSKWNKQVFLFDNIVDILDQNIVRSERAFYNRLVWFGMPENAVEIDRLRVPHPVTRITRGGDIEYQVKTIDAHLIDFDLALLPVTLNAYTQAKNANRMVKCIGLGLPFLASDTPEHRRALARLGMPDVFLVGPDDDWSARIADIGRNYETCLGEITAARQRVFEVYGVESIARAWINYCSEITDLEKK